MDANTESPIGSWFDDCKPPSPSYRTSIDPVTAGLVVGGSAISLYAITLGIYERPDRQEPTLMDLVCSPTFWGTELVLMCGMILCMILSVKMYCETNRFWTIWGNFAIDRF